MRPALLCKLKKGTVIDANLGFVDTFNWLVDFCNNLCGDGDRDQAKSIKVDKAVDDRPVIRLQRPAENSRAFMLNGETIANFVSTDEYTEAVEMIVPSLLGRNGITLTVEEDSDGYPVIVISGSGSGGGEAVTSGFSGTRVVLAEYRYQGHELQAKYFHETWADGLLVSSTLDDAWTPVTTAVPESVCHCEATS